MSFHRRTAVSLSLLLCACTGTLDGGGDGGDPDLQVAEDIEYDEEVWLERLYETVLGRASDEGGYDYWISRIFDDELPIEAVAGAFLRSQEYHDRVIGEVYGRYLKRGVDPGGLDTYRGLLAKGVRDEQLEAWVLSSAEYAGRGANDAGGIVTNLYRDVLGREPDPDGFAFWTGALAGGTPLEDVARGFVDSQENRRNVIATYYVRYLGRAPDAGGWDDWTNVLAGGATREAIQAGFVLSEEFLGATVDGEGLEDDGGDDEGYEDDGGGEDDGETFPGEDCPEDFCDDGTCIPYDQFCDGVVQCPDGSDESPDYCAE